MTSRSCLRMGTDGRQKSLQTYELKPYTDDAVSKTVLTVDTVILFPDVFEFHERLLFLFCLALGG